MAMFQKAIFVTPLRKDRGHRPFPVLTLYFDTATKFLENRQIPSNILQANDETANVRNMNDKSIKNFEL